MTKLIATISLSLLITASSLRVAVADDETRKVVSSVSVFDGHAVVLGELVREEVPKGTDVIASKLQQLITERAQLKQRLLEVEALIKKHAKE